MAEQLTPMMQKYTETKEQYNDCILFYRLGDFYEMFFDDALTVTKELEITLTGKSCGLKERAPMCGVPFHSAETYINRLVEKGYKVAICEQVEDPKLAKGLVKREVVRIVTPGTNCFSESLDESKNNYLAGIVVIGKNIGLSAVDVTTGEFIVTEIDEPGKLLDEINRLMPSEIICNDAFCMSDIDIDDLKNRLNITISVLDSYYFDKVNCLKALTGHFKTANIESLGINQYQIEVLAAGAVMQYLEETQKCSMNHISHLQLYQTGKFMILDRNTRRNLELTETLREKQKRGSLLWVLDKTKTALGARKLRSSIEQPLINKQEILKRYDAIEQLNLNIINREEIREYLNPIYDLERLMSKISYKSVNPRDMIALSTSLEMLPFIKNICLEFDNSLFKELCDGFDTLEDIYNLINNAIIEEPPVSVREGGIFKLGYNEEVDKLRSAKTDGKNWLAQLESREKEKTGIKNLRIKFNKVFGYYLEVTNSYKELVPPEWTRKQTLTNCERYTTSELKEMEETIMGAEDRLFNLEYALFCDLRDRIFDQMERIQKTAAVIANIDMLCSLAYVAEHSHYVHPSLNDDGIIKINEGRHPVIEKMIENDMFISNDTYLDEAENRSIIITGPNMAGKSTYMRQAALITLMAQIGSFVPAKSADISIVDRIFTRVGASDDLASGQSTFMVEMTEVANILHNATKNSLIILDEIGRGTSTFDGLSIARAVIEFITNEKNIGAKTLFATHYHELTELEGKIKGIKNCCIAVKEEGEDVVFLRKIIKGGADKSYGIQVAKLAGIPDVVLKRAREIADHLESEDLRMEKVSEVINESKQMSLFDYFDDNNDSQKDNILSQIKETNLSNITPLDALNLINEWQKELVD